MPIVSIISEPAATSLNAAYNPVVLRVSATRTDGNAVPPVVYCDIYLNGVYYKSLGKTVYDKINGSTDSEFEFDISDALQEKLRIVPPVNGGTEIIELPSVYADVQCKFRSSGYNTDGFLTAEGTAPIQGTGTISPVSGTGTASNSFFVINSALQHEDNQDLASHLSFYRPAGTWTDAYPLSHRPKMFISKGDSDYFPIAYTGGKDIRCVRLHYKPKGSAYTFATGCKTCSIAVTGLSVTLNSSNKFELSWTNDGGVPHHVVILYSTDGVHYGSTMSTFNGSLDTATVNDDIAVDGLVTFKVIPYCDAVTAGLAAVAGYNTGATASIVVKNAFIASGSNVNTFLVDGSNQLTATLSQGDQQSVYVFDLAISHALGVRLSGVNANSSVEIIQKRGSTVINSYNFIFVHHFTTYSTPPWLLQANDVIEIKELV